MDTYEKKYKEAQKWIESIYPNLSHEQQMEAEAFFPELAESEDEKIRKELIAAFQNGVTYNQISKARAKDYIAWLEKQGHTDGIIEKAKTEKQRVIITETDGNANIDWDTRSLEDARKLLECGLQYINTELAKQGKEDSSIQQAYEQGYTEGKRIERKHWIEKQADNKQRQYDIDILEKHITKDSISELAHTVIVRNGWEIVDTKEQKPDWSEEDDEIINGITSYLCTHDSCELDGFNKWYDWLKSLKQRATWKPSDAQMQALKETCDKHWEPDGLDPLYTLYQQLKK